MDFSDGVKIFALACISWLVLGICGLVLLARGGRPFSILMEGLNIRIRITRPNYVRKSSTPRITEVKEN